MTYYIIIALILILEFVFAYIFNWNGWFVVICAGVIIFNQLIIIAVKSLFANKKKS